LKGNREKVDRDQKDSEQRETALPLSASGLQRYAVCTWNFQ
jgi:hypothetical protein